MIALSAPLVVVWACVTAAPASPAAGMRGYAATSPNCATQSYSTGLRAPRPGLRATYAGLPPRVCSSDPRGSLVHQPSISPRWRATLACRTSWDPTSAARCADAACAESSSLRVGDNVWGDIGANTRTKKSNAKTKELGSYARSSACGYAAW